ncbi:hypothetical protein F0P96_11370 [Hymenobacter busanensis]|uniref:Uncharacterized protein n=1 Tax=Hymenobacter busanensis TaxID=2607656 RepID=A0A7L4ZZL7_9BACT|nr:hypothetical protein [Hymenobacter busanensis]KAA9332080.1 hypothetical protein F0P96_11370 [Hymenobacter busanensis]QHJ07582.1 hypothetical protein GUY19_09905 [Hymenobacter busanensis]
MWASRLTNLLDEYTRRCAVSKGVSWEEYDDANLEEARKEMTATMDNVRPFIKRIKESTKQLPVIGDRIMCAPGTVDADARVAERIFYAPRHEPSILGVVYFLDTDQYDHLAEYER